MTKLWELDRRTLLKGAAATAIAGVATKRAFATPRRGGNMRLAFSGASAQDSLDPTTYIGTSMYLVSYASKSALTEISAQNTVVPALAESWEFDDGAKRWVFNLRKGVTFHSGKSLTAEDVVASVNLHRGTDSTSPIAPFAAQIMDVVADGKDRVIFTLKGGNADFHALMSAVHMRVLPSKDGKIEDRTTRDGTGAYILENLEPGVRANLRRNPNYWNADIGFVETAEIQYVADTAARMNALRGGFVDVINQVDVKTASLLKRVPGVKVEEKNGGQHDVFCMMTDIPPFNDPNVRLALKYAINRQEMVDKILLGHGAVANDIPLPVTHPYYAKDIPQRKYDPDKTRFYLKNSGLTSIEIPLSVAETGFYGSTDAGVLYAATAKDCGIDIKLVREPEDSYWQQTWMKKPFSVNYWPGQVSADMQLSWTYAENSAWNETHWKNPRFNELLTVARAETDETKRRGMYHEMQQLIHDDGGAVIPMYMNHLWATSSKVSHQDEVGGEWELDGLRCIERWWLNE